MSAVVKTDEAITEQFFFSFITASFDTRTKSKNLLSLFSARRYYRSQRIFDKVHRRASLLRHFARQHDTLHIFI